MAPGAPLRPRRRREPAQEPVGRGQGKAHGRGRKAPGVDLPLPPEVEHGGLERNRDPQPGEDEGDGDIQHVAQVVGVRERTDEKKVERPAGRPAQDEDEHDHQTEGEQEGEGQTGETRQETRRGSSFPSRWRVLLLRPRRARNRPAAPACTPRCAPWRMAPVVGRSAGIAPPPGPGTSPRSCRRCPRISSRLEEMKRIPAPGVAHLQYLLVDELAAGHVQPPCGLGDDDEVRGGGELPRKDHLLDVAARERADGARGPPSMEKLFVRRSANCLIFFPFEKTRAQETVMAGRRSCSPSPWTAGSSRAQPIRRHVRQPPLAQRRPGQDRRCPPRCAGSSRW